MRLRATTLIVLALLARAGAAIADDTFYYTDVVTPLIKAGATVIDSRPLAACQERSMREAHCFPAATFLGPHHRLAALPDILWALGTGGLTGEETVVVVGEEPTARDFVAGMLYLVGQRNVVILRTPVSLLRDAIGVGTARSVVREHVFQASVRDQLWVLRRELATQLASAPPIVLDGRTESEFWGETVRAVRGGHLPGAESLPASSLRAAMTRGEPIGPFAGEPVAYAHDVVDSVAFFTSLRAGAGISARVYPGGWAEWSNDGALPADAATYPDRAAMSPAAVKSPTLGFPGWLSLVAAMLLGAVLAVGGVYFGRRRLGGGRA